MSGIAYANGQLWVADANRIGALPQDHRVLMFSTGQVPDLHGDITTSGLVNALCYLCGFPASNTLGQTGFAPTDTSVSPPVFDPGLSNDPTKPQFNSPTAVATDGIRLAVADTDNNRILLWNSLPTAFDQPANLVLGQADFTSRQQPGAGAISPTILRGPQGVWIQNGKLYVADTQNHRVLIWNSFPTQNNQPPDLALGQPNLSSAIAPPSTQVNPPAAANRLFNPTSVSSDGTRLFVSDLGFNRVLIWNTIPNSMDQSADVVVGQPDMTGSTPNNPSVCGSNPTGLDQQCVTSLNFPRFALSDGQRLYVADGGNDRVLIFNSIPTSNGAPADTVLGQPDFTTNTSTSQAISIASTAIDNTGAVDTTPTPTSLAYDPVAKNLYVSDPYNRRVLIFTPGDTPLPANSIVNWASEIIRQEGIVTIGLAAGGAITAGDTVTIAIQAVNYTYTVKTGDTLDTIAQGLIALINATDTNVTAFFAGAGSGTVYLSSKLSNLPYDSISLSATSSNLANIAPVASGSYLSAGTAATGAAGMLVEVNAAAGTSFTDTSTPAIAPLSGNLPSRLNGVQLYMDGIAVPLLRVSPSQIVGQVPFYFGGRNSTSVYVRTVHNDGSVTGTNAQPLYIAPANPGIFNAPSYPGQPRPWPASQAFHQPGNPTAVVSIDGAANATDTATITVNGRSYTYTVVAGDTLASIATALINKINAAPDPDVVASAGAAFSRVVLTARQSGAAGTGIPITGASSTNAQVTVTAYTSATCCAVQPNSPITTDNPAGLGELIVVNSAGLGLVDDPTGAAVNSLATGAPYTGPVNNTATNFVTATMAGSTAQVISAGFNPGAYGIYSVQMIVPTNLTANAATQLNIAQNAFISNTVTIPVGTTVAGGGTPQPVNPIIMYIDSPGASSTQSGTIALAGWAISSLGTITNVALAVDGVSAGNAVYGNSRPDVCAAYGPSAGCPNVGWLSSLDTTLLVNGAHSLQVTVADAAGTRRTIAQTFTVSNDVVNNPTHIYSDVPGPGYTYLGTVNFKGWAINDFAAVTSVSVSVDGAPRGGATYGSDRPDVCTAFGPHQGCPNVGWSYLMDTTVLANGVHTFAITANAANGQHSVVSSTFTVANSPGVTPVRAVIDVPNTNSAAFSGIAAIQGWAISNDTSIGSVSVAVDGVPLGNAAYGVNRPDVCAFFPTAAGCPNVGWNATIDTTQFADGAHTLTVTVNPVGEQSYTISRPFNISNLGSGSPLRIYTDVPGNGATLAGVAALQGWTVSSSGTITNVKISVDGAAFGTATYGGSRPDVCVFYPGQGCPNVGWNFTLDTRRITNGSHALEVTSTTSSGQRGTISSVFNVANTANGAGKIYFDQPGSGSSPFSGIANFRGWAINDSAAVTAVSVTVDGIPFGGATYGQSRPDVCAAYPGRAGCPNVGWSFSIDTTQLLDGAHTLGVTETVADGSFYTAQAPFTVGNFTATSPVTLYIDSPTGETTPFSGALNFLGWAIDDVGSIQSVSIAVDGVPYGSALYGLPRPDVCSVFSGRQNCPNVGWNFVLDGRLVANGIHTIAATATTASGQSTTLTRPVNVSN